MKSRFLLIKLHPFALRFATNVAWPLKCTFFLLSFFVVVWDLGGGLLFLCFFFVCYYQSLIFDNRVRRGVGRGSISDLTSQSFCLDVQMLELVCWCY